MRLPRPDESGLAMTNEGGWGRDPPLRVNVVRGFSIVSHDPEGSHYRILKFPMKAEQLQKSGLLVVGGTMSGSHDKIKLPWTGSGERVAKQPLNFERGLR